MFPCRGRAGGGTQALTCSREAYAAVNKDEGFWGPGRTCYKSPFLKVREL